MQLLDGKKIAEKIYSELKKEISAILETGVTPRLVVVLVGDNPASLSYIEAKRKQAERLGIKFEFFHFPEDIDQHSLCRKIVDLNRLSNVFGIVVQLPLPEKFQRQQVLDCVLPSLDIDGLTSSNQTKLSAGKPAFVPPTPAAILKLLEEYQISLADKHIVIVGAGELVGKPLNKILVQRGLTVSVATAKTKNLSALTKNADILVTAVGKPGLIKGPMVKKGAVVIDAGTAFTLDQGKVKLTGDVDFKRVAVKASYITPVPGGVGPLTVAFLFKNFVQAYKQLS